MIKFLHYIVGLGLIIFGMTIGFWFYAQDDLLYLINHMNTAQGFARTFSPLVSIYLGWFYLYHAVRCKINPLSTLSLVILITGSLLSLIILFLTPYTFGGTMPYYGWGVLFLLSIITSFIISFLSLFRKDKVS
jgi:hypothetical protein